MLFPNQVRFIKTAVSRYYRNEHLTTITNFLIFINLLSFFIPLIKEKLREHFLFQDQFDYNL